MVKNNNLDIDSWTDEFVIFSSIDLSVHNGKAQDILKYMQNIRGLKRQTGIGWKSYDEQFRLRLASYPTASSFGEIDYELWLLCMVPRLVISCSRRISTLYLRNVMTIIIGNVTRLVVIIGMYVWFVIWITLPGFALETVSPVGLVPTSDNSWKRIAHLSYPSVASVNDGIDDSTCCVYHTPRLIRLLRWYVSLDKEHY